MNPTKILIPKPCNKGWDNMTPNSSGRHCDTCDKTVVDFTQMDKEEIKTFFIQKAGAKICGHFRASQVEVPKSKIHTKLISIKNYLDQKVQIRLFKKISLTTITICMFLVGCGNKKVVGEKIKAPEKNLEPHELTGAIAMPPIRDSAKPIKKCKVDIPTVEGKMEIKEEEPMVDGDMIMEVEEN